MSLDFLWQLTVLLLELLNVVLAENSDAGIVGLGEVGDRLGIANRNQPH